MLGKWHVLGAAGGGGAGVAGRAAGNQERHHPVNRPLQPRCNARVITHNKSRAQIVKTKQTKCCRCCRVARKRPGRHNHHGMNEPVPRTAKCLNAVQQPQQHNKAQTTRGQHTKRRGNCHVVRNVVATPPNPVKEPLNNERQAEQTSRRGRQQKQYVVHATGIRTREQ